MNKILYQLGLAQTFSGVGSEDRFSGRGSVIPAISPIDSRPFAKARCANTSEYNRIFLIAGKAFLKWRTVPPPRRGEMAPNIGMTLRRAKTNLDALITLEASKTRGKPYGPDFPVAA